MTKHYNKKNNNFFSLRFKNSIYRPNKIFCYKDTRHKAKIHYTEYYFAYAGMLA